jgi:hypothetical protein
MKIAAEGFEFDFKDAKYAFKFDEEDSSLQTFHGAPMMKAVDIIVEFDDSYLFVEVKKINIHDDTTNAIKNTLKYKFRDSFLYRYLEDKVDKPIHYVCLLAFENNQALEINLNKAVEKALQQELPFYDPEKNGRPKRWTRDLVSSCFVVNLNTWNNNKILSQWPVKKI